MVPGVWPKGVTVGRYVSVGPGVHAFLRNHPLDRLSMHPFFYNSQLKYVPVDNIEDGHLEIGHDAWIGANVIVTPKCFRIGIGAVIAAGSIVTKDVPDFAVVAGNPAKILYFRFEQQVMDEILEGKWWENSVDECVKDMAMMVKPLACDEASH